MAARRRTTTKTGSEIVVVNAGGNTPARRTGGGGLRRRRRGRSRSRSKRSSSSSTGGVQRSIPAVALGGLAYGLLVKYFPGMPKLPVVGRSGTVALAIYLLKPTNHIIQSVGIAAAAIAGYSFGETGSVSGYDEESVLASQA